MWQQAWSACMHECRRCSHVSESTPYFSDFTDPVDVECHFMVTGNPAPVTPMIVPRKFMPFQPSKRRGPTIGKLSDGSRQKETADKCKSQLYNKRQNQPGYTIVIKGLYDVHRS